MKKTIITAGIAVLLSAAAFGQTMHSYESEHYSVRSELGNEHAGKTAEMMESFFHLFQSYLHFNDEKLDTHLNVKVFDKKEAYDSYIESLISETRDSFVFLHYENKPEKSELVAFNIKDEELYRKRLIHHGFIQYIKSFVPHPPLWLQKGFAVYFEHSSYNAPTKNAEFRHNYGWVEYLRSRLSRDKESLDLIPLNNLLYISGEMANLNLEAFYAQTWSMIEFMVHSDTKAYNRLLWDSLSALSPEADTRENASSVVGEAFEWVNRESLVADYIRFVENIRTFPDLVELGMEAYSMGNYDKAEDHFSDAVELNEAHYVPHYYLGLISYEKGEYSMAEYYYQTARKSGGDPALINYALGVNAFANRRFDDAAYYLKEAQSRDEKYADKADRLLKRIESAESSEGGESPEGSESSADHESSQE